MLNHIIGFSLKNRATVLLAALVVVVLGMYRLAHMPIDVFPDLNRPTVTVMTEAPGFAPEEVEVLVTRPVEYLLNGASQVRRVRSASGIGLSIVWVEFDWGTDIYRDRQIVSEKLQLARNRLPAGVNPVLAPISSIMGEILLIGMNSKVSGKNNTELNDQAMELRTLGEFTVRNRLLAVEGVSQVTVMGGILKQYQVITSPDRLAAQSITLQQLVDAAEKANALAGGGILERKQEEQLIRIRGQSITPEDIGETPVIWREKRAVRIRDVADVRFGGPVRRGDGSIIKRNPDSPENNPIGGDSVILAIQKQPGANTLELTPRIESVLDQLQRELPAWVQIERGIFRQASFIQAAVDNVIEAIRDGTLWVVLVLFLFLANFRTSIITLTAIPLSVLVTALVFHGFGISINTMTLGGIAVAIGELVDDAIVDVENIFRRLNENQGLEKPLPVLQVIYQASCEVRNSIVYATLIVCLVVMPLFFLPGLEGRMFAPLALAYMVSLLASLGVSLTVTPALTSFLLTGTQKSQPRKDPLLLRFLKWIDEKVIRLALRFPRVILVIAAILAFGSKIIVLWLGSEFLPPFNEGTMTINVQTRPGTSLEESRRIAERTETLLWQVPEITTIARRTGRAEQDEHAEGVNTSELDIGWVPPELPKPGLGFALLRAVPGLNRFGWEKKGRSHDLVLADIRERLSRLPNVNINVGQPISHRLDHLMSGVRAQIAIKVFGQDLRELVAAAYDVQDRLSKIPGVVDLQVEPQENIKQIRLEVDRKAAANYGLAPGDVARLLETAYKGRVVSTVLDMDRYFDLVVWYDEAARSDRSVIGQTILDTPSGRKVALSQVAHVLDARGPNTINHENGKRRVVIGCNVQGRDLGRVVEEIRRALLPIEESLRALPGGYYIEMGGQFDAQKEANTLLFWLFWAVLFGVFLLLWKCLDSWVAGAMVLLINIPLAALGSVLMLLFLNQPEWDSLNGSPWYDWPRLWASATTLSVAHWVGFITLVGIVTRNGILMIAHYIHLQKVEQIPFTDELIVRGTLERLAPVMMTALTAILGLIPLALGAGQTGKEILHPLAIVVIGGLIDSTLMDQIVTPAAYKLFGKWVVTTKP